MVYLKTSLICHPIFHSELSNVTECHLVLIPYNCRGDVQPAVRRLLMMKISGFSNQSSRWQNVMNDYGFHWCQYYEVISGEVIYCCLFSSVWLLSVFVLLPSSLLLSTHSISLIYFFVSHQHEAMGSAQWPDPVWERRLYPDQGPTPHPYGTFWQSY